MPPGQSIAGFAGSDPLKRNSENRQHHGRVHANQLAPSSFFEKFDDYASEQEYRFVVRAPQDEYLQLGLGDALKGVVLGAEFPDAELRPLFFLCAELGAALLRMEWRQGLGQIAGFYNPTIPFEHNHAPEVQPHRDELHRWHPSLADYEARTRGIA